MENSTIYEFTYRDEEGDVYSSEEHSSISECRKELQKLKLTHFQIKVEETWKYVNGEFKGRFNL